MKMNFTAFLAAFACSAGVFAGQVNDENTILHVTIQNNTTEVIQFDHIINANPGNVFNVNPVKIAPGETGIITAEKTLNNDIFAQLSFTDAHQLQAVLTLLDQEQVHMGQPIFNMKGNSYSSELISKRRNKNIGPRYLTYIEANLRITIQKKGR